MAIESIKSESKIAADGFDSKNQCSSGLFALGSNRIFSRPQPLMADSLYTLEALGNLRAIVKSFETNW